MTNIAASADHLLTIGREEIARVIHCHLKPENLTNADWDSGSILGAGNGWRRDVYSAADAIIASLAQGGAA